MANDSSTGGYLLPAASPAPLEGKDLLAFLQGWLVGITGLPGTMVRPRWQPEPPDIPQAGDAWAALGVVRRPSDEYPFVSHQPSVGDWVQRHELLEVLTSFYDLGSTGLADYYAALFREGSAVEQNRWPLVAAGMNLVRVGALVAVPSLLKLRWLYRVDLEIAIRRQIDRLYPVRDLVAAQGDIFTDGGLPPQPFSATTTE